MERIGILRLPHQNHAIDLLRAGQIASLMELKSPRDHASDVLLRCFDHSSSLFTPLRTGQPEKGSPIPRARCRL
jgi:hypothetical protein